MTIRAFLSLATLLVAGGLLAAPQAKPGARAKDAKASAPASSPTTTEAATKAPELGAQAPSTTPAEPAVPVIAIVSDDDLPIHRRVVTGLVVESRAEVIELNLGGDASLGEKVMKRALAESPVAIVAVGPKSLVAAMAATKDVPIVYCLVPRLEAYDLKAANVAGVRLEAAPTAPLEVLQKTLPKVRKVAVVFNPDESSDAVDELKRGARSVGMEIVPVEVRVPEHVRESLAKSSADAILMIPDPTALHLTSFSAMLDHASEQKIPLFALNARFVERGALLAFATDYPALGRQVGRIVNGLVEGEVAIDAIREVDPEGLELAYNMSTARALGAPAGFSAALLEVGAERGALIRVYR
jgi:putative ABC transport system substrate-binding protein